MEAVAALFGRHVQLQTARRRIGRAPASLVNHLLVAGIIHITLNRTVTLKAIDNHPIHQNRSLRGAGSVHSEIGLLHRPGAAYIRRIQVHTDHELPHGLDGVGGRHGIQHVTRKDLRLEIRLRIHNRRFRGDRYRFFNAAHRHLGIDGCCKVRRQFHITLYGLETGKAERYAVVARSQVDDLVRPAFIRDGRTRLLDQRGAAGFDGHPRQDSAALVLHDSCERALGKSLRTRDGYKQTGDGNPLQCPHPSSFSAKPRM